MQIGFRRNSLKYSVNEKFFDSWNSQMAYVLGFTYSDGNIYKTSLAWDIQKRDKNILVKIKKAMKSSYPITERPNSFRFRMSNQKLNEGIMGKGLVENKSKRMKLPKIPQEFTRHFVRGFLDGDGWITIRKSRNEVDLGFVSGNRIFLEDLSKTILDSTGVVGWVREKNKTTRKGLKSKTFLMEYYSSNAVEVADWLFENLRPLDIYLDRKYMQYLRVKKLSDYLKSGTKKVRVIQEKLQKSLNDILNDLYLKRHLDGVQIANVLGVHSSSIYRWLARYGIKYPIQRKVGYGQI